MSPARPYPGPAADRRDGLLDPEEEAALQSLRRATETVRPCGDASFVAQLERKLGRILRPLKRGPKPKSKGEEEKGLMDLFESNG